MATGISKLLPSLIKQDQDRFVAGGQAPDTTRRISNLIHHIETSDEPSLLLTLDAEKAFNRVHLGILVTGPP